MKDDEHQNNLLEGRIGEGRRLSDRLIRILLDSMPIPTFVIDRNNRLIVWNKALEAMTGIPAERVLGRRQHWNAFYRKQRPCLADILVEEKVLNIAEWYGNKCVASPLLQNAYEGIDFFPDIGNGGKWIRFTAAALHDDNGRLIGAMETLEDITEKMHIQEALRESETALAGILRGSPIPTFVIDRQHRVTHWNRALEKLSGIPAGHIIGTKHQWRSFYAEERPCMSDLLVDQKIEELDRWYAARATPSKLIQEAFEAVDFFPNLENGKWLRFTAALLRNSLGEIVGAVETLEDITDRKQAETALIESEQRYRDLSVTDSLTKLFNSRHFFRQFSVEVERANRYNHALTLLFIDIDNFKHFNDRYGHLEGDTVLVRLGNTIRQSLRKTDSAYRLGGEEFLVLMPETAGDDACVLAERIRHEFEREPFLPDEHDECHVTVSIGIAQYISKESTTSFLRRADEGMYRAKELGKNMVYFNHFSEAAAP
ncbi:MAG: diguanylate cyclase [Deltaproteobacteria bacterium]|nr:diguanylate cyclase [Deltaproteobacteria bacterium]